MMFCTTEILWKRLYWGWKMYLSDSDILEFDYQLCPLIAVRPWAR